MIEYKSLPKSELKELPELGRDGWITSILVDGIIILYREVKKKRGTVNKELSKEWLEFRSKYPTKSGIYDDRLGYKYNQLVKEGLHEDIMKSLELYEKELEVTGKPVCNASTFINQKRWLQDFKVTRAKSDEWMNEYLVGLDSAKILQVKETAKYWEKEHPNKSITPGILQNIISKYNKHPYV